MEGDYNKLQIADSLQIEILLRLGLESTNSIIFGYKYSQWSICLYLHYKKIEVSVKSQKMLDINNNSR